MKLALKLKPLLNNEVKKFKAKLEDNLEFIQFKRWCENLYNTGTLQLDYKSCEMISDDLYTHINKKYPDRFVVIDVAEDGENGCQIIYNNYKEK